ncbi:hypothetical protein AYI68_g7654 [Smittium mucronatum]|uniref:Uncharacterized protein n=1 Tax=Smittium mucronatum TaxID=133383 RepID=A0A1R0GN39_9FUNG|nr:hypothetical protein AYI68_g7654 [Smittium mucronatum]
MYYQYEPSSLLNLRLDLSSILGNDLTYNHGSSTLLKVSISPDSKFLVGITNDSIYLWNLKSKTYILTILLQPFLIFSATKHDGVLKFGPLVDVFWNSESTSFYILTHKCVIFDYKLELRHPNSELTYLNSKSLSFTKGPNEGSDFKLFHFYSGKVFVLEDYSSFSAGIVRLYSVSKSCTKIIKSIIVDEDEINDITLIRWNSAGDAFLAVYSSIIKVYSKLGIHLFSINISDKNPTKVLDAIWGKDSTEILAFGSLVSTKNPHDNNPNSSSITSSVSSDIPNTSMCISIPIFKSARSCDMHQILSPHKKMLFLNDSQIIYCNSDFMHTSFLVQPDFLWNTIDTDFKESYSRKLATSLTHKFFFKTIHEVCESFAVTKCRNSENSFIISISIFDGSKISVINLNLGSTNNNHIEGSSSEKAPSFVDCDLAYDLNLSFYPSSVNTDGAIINGVEQKRTVRYRSFHGFGDLFIGSSLYLHKEVKEMLLDNKKITTLYFDYPHFSISMEILLYEFLEYEEKGIDDFFKYIYTSQDFYKIISHCARKIEARYLKKLFKHAVKCINSDNPDHQADSKEEADGKEMESVWVQEFFISCIENRRTVGLEVATQLLVVVHSIVDRETAQILTLYLLDIASTDSENSDILEQIVKFIVTVNKADDEPFKQLIDGLEDGEKLMIDS